jgi:hypothetical protein
MIAMSDKFGPTVLASSGLNDNWLDRDPMPELPSLGRRWTVSRKAAVIEAVRGGWMPIEEVCEVYNISVDEFLSWERDIDRYGIHGLRSTRFQIYRNRDTQRRQ